MARTKVDIRVSINEEVKHSIKHYAAKNGVSVSSLVERALRDILAEEDRRLGREVQK